MGGGGDSLLGVCTSLQSPHAVKRSKDRGREMKLKVRKLRTRPDNISVSR